MNGYLELIWSQLFSSIYFAIIGLLVGGGLIFLLKKRKYLERQHVLLKLLTKFYSVYFPFVFLVSFWFAGSLWTTVNLFEKEVTKVIVEIEDKTYPIFIKYVNDGVDEFLAQESLPTNDEIVSNFINETLDENAAQIYKYTMRISLTTLLEYMVGKDSEREKRIRILSEGVSKDLLKVGFDFIKKEVRVKVIQILLLFLIPIVVGFLGAMFFPTVEIIIYNLFFKEKKEL
jgi:hypothetical protein